MARRSSTPSVDAVRLLALTHLSPRYFGPELLEEATAVFPATVCPRDFDVIEVPLLRAGFRLDTPAVIESGRRAKLVFLCSPNNPTGTYLPFDEVKRLHAGLPPHVLLVLDATVGQNAIGQVELFQKAAGVTGLVMTKLDGTARGGILVALAQKFGLPVHFIGVGEGVEDLEPFAARDFARAIAGLESP